MTAKMLGEIQKKYDEKNEGEKDDDIRGGIKDYVFYIYFKKKTKI